MHLATLSFLEYFLFTSYVSYSKVLIFLWSYKSVIFKKMYFECNKNTIKYFIENKKNLIVFSVHAKSWNYAATHYFAVLCPWWVKITILKLKLITNGIVFYDIDINMMQYLNYIILIQSGNSFSFTIFHLLYTFNRALKF